MSYSKYSISDETFEWLSKIDSLCRANNVKFQIASPPVPISQKEQSHNWLEMRKSVKNKNLESLFDDYFETIQYLDDKYLRDHIHWKDSLIKKNKQYYINTIKEKLMNSNN